MKKKRLEIIYLVGGLVLLFLLPFLIQNVKGLSLSSPSRTVRTKKLNPTTEMFETRGDYQIKDGKVIFDFKFINHYAEAKKLQFGSGQQFEIIIKNEEDDEVYRYSEGKFFTLALVYRKIEAGKSLHWQDQWDMRDKEGKFVSPGKYQAEIDIMPIPNAAEAKIEDRQLRTTIEFTLLENEVKSRNEETKNSTSQEAKEIIADIANEVIQAISKRDAGKIGAYVHPKKGVRFTPYTYVNVEADLVFTPEEISNFFTDQKLYLWGHYDGTGDPINLTPSDYYKEFIYSADFIQAEEIGYNEVLGMGNMLENQFGVYENPIIVEYYFSGFDPAFMGMDWQSIRLVFEEYKSTWKLTGIIHNQWTI